MGPAPRADAPTAVHWVGDGHDTPARGIPLSTNVGDGVPVEIGSNVNRRVRIPWPGVQGSAGSDEQLATAVHWLVDGHETATGPPAPFTPGASTVVGVGVPGDVGLNVTWCPAATVDGRALSWSPDRPPR